MIKNRRYIISTAVLVACVCGVLGVLAVLPPRPGPTKANFDLIKKGMTHAEVFAILGECDIEPAKPGAMHSWRLDDGTESTVCFDGDEVFARDFQPSPETLPDKLRRWLHLPPAE
jgi:hypothetical protein